MIRGLRGAITVEADIAEQVWEETAKLVTVMAEQNNITPEQITSVIISTTPDITSAFPAKAVRLMEGWQYVPVMCMHEMNVAHALPLCIRVLMHADVTVTQKEVQHVYLNEAVKLRPDLVK
ncbi:MAG TPA: chorismate mutase [Metalysinibacillus jejuensis]|uniref:chorismate mutase n=1 Tax=Metalysinibacillus jejuensis TaxID=914327 RepID=A0A921T5D6_9BACL|nr:chorismate mutase [Metalysinibacillus jejuensis]HJH11840.1 chorismate mutase [Metalysinibacillus jejuensis]